MQRGERGRRVPAGLVCEGLQDEDLDDARASAAALGGCEQPIKESQCLPEFAGVPLDAVPGDQQPRQGEVLVLAQVGRAVFGSQLPFPGPLFRVSELAAPEP